MNSTHTLDQTDAVALGESERATEPTPEVERTTEAGPERCSLDPMRATDRYRLVTPYLLSGSDL